MPPIRVDFYLLQSDKQEANWLVACRLLEKAYAKKHSVYVHCTTQDEAEHLDELLWTYKADSFIPHNLQGEGPEPPPPVQIGFGKEPRGYSDILFNMAPEIPAFHGKFKRIIEIVPGLEAQREQSRAHYKAYRALGYALHTHQIEEPLVETEAN